MSTTTPVSPITPGTAAPIPSLDTMTPGQLADHHTAVVLHRTGVALAHTRRGHHAEAHQAFAESTSAYTIAYLARALMEHAPDAADKVVQQLGQTFVHGNASEWAREWAAAVGLDADALVESGIQAAKEATGA